MSGNMPIAWREIEAKLFALNAVSVYELDNACVYFIHALCLVTLYHLLPVLGDILFFFLFFPYFVDDIFCVCI